MHYNAKNYYLLISFLIMLLISCSDSKISTPSQGNDISTTISSYPITIQEEHSSTASYPLEEVSTPVFATMEPAELPLALPIPEVGFATLGGIVIDEQTRQAPEESLLFLGEVVYTDKGLPIISVDRQNDPVVVLQPNGAFIFENIPPGEYGVVFFTPDFSFLLEDSNTNESLIVTLVEDEVLDIGLYELPAR